MVSGLDAARLAHAPANFVTPVGLAKNAHTPCILPRRECSRFHGAIVKWAANGPAVV